jgi:dTDP-4-dehydrorhamnose reductase
MKILITGKSGQVGHELDTHFHGLGQVISLDRSGMDLSNLKQVRDVIQTIKPHLIINPAAYTAVDKAEQEAELAMRVNGEAPAVMAEEARKIGAAVIHYSTDYVFDGSKADAYTEDDSTNPLNIYGKSKLAGELAIRSSGVPHLIFRTSWVYGGFGKNFMLTMLRLGQEREELRIVDDQFGTPTWSRTLALQTKAIIQSIYSEALQKTESCDEMVDHTKFEELTGVYHLTGQGQTTWYGFAKSIFENSSLKKKPRIHPISTEDYPLPAKRPKNSVLNCDKFERVFGSLPHWEEALRLCESSMPKE